MRVSRADFPVASGRRLPTTASGCAGSDVRGAPDNVVSLDVVEVAPLFAAPFGMGRRWAAVSGDRPRYPGH